MKRSSDGSAKKASGQEQEQWLGEDYQLKIPDVFCGSRGSQDQENRHPGNKRFKVAVTLRLEQYRNAETKYDKSMIVKDIISSVHESGGRFVRQKEGKWYDIGLPKARDKVTTAIRLMLGLKNKAKDPPSETDIVPSDMVSPSADWASFSSHPFQQSYSHAQVSSGAPDAKVPTIQNAEPFPLAVGESQATSVAFGPQPHLMSFKTVESRTAENHGEVDPQIMDRKPSAVDQIRPSSGNESAGFLPPDSKQELTSSTSHGSHSTLDNRGLPFDSKSLFATIDGQYQFEQAEAQQSSNVQVESFSMGIAHIASAAEQKVNTSQEAKLEDLAPQTQSRPSSKDSHVSYDGSKSSGETSSFERSVARRTFTPSSDSNADSNEESTGKQETSPFFRSHDNSPDSLTSLDRKPPAT